MLKYKSLFASKTFWGAIFTLIVAGAPMVGNILSERQETGKVDFNKVAQLAAILAGAGATIIGRVQATDRLYTPDGLPGPNLPVNEAEENEAHSASNDV